MKKIFPYTLCALVALLMFSCEPLIKPQHHFSVLFDANGGDGDMDAQILAEGVIDHLAENGFQREGYTFVGWNTAPDGSGTSYDDADLFKTDQNITLYAQWEKLLFPLFFEANGGSGNMSAQMIKYDESTALNENTFIRGGYRFTGWNTEADGSGKAYKDKQEIVITQESYLYAQWTMLSSGTENGHSYIDLGLPSGLKWASFNLGAKTPEGSGDYFAWGETEPKKEYSWESYKWSIYSDGAYKMTKYNTDIQYGSVVDNKESLEIEDDAAHVNWQGKWRMPTSVEYAELINYCTWTWASQNGISGFIVKSEVNDNSIFLPAAGWYVKSGCEYISKWGFYWLNNLTPGISPLHAYYWKFYSELYKQPYDHIDYVSRYYGMPIRPVYAEFAIVTFNANGGQGEMPAQQFAIGESQALMSNAFTRAGYTFTGWNTAPDGSGTAYYNHQIISPEQNLTLYAQWEEDQVISGSENGYDYVDLGLPSGTKWATCNVGATTPEGYGDYFAWGETEPKSEYEWSTYKYSEGSSSLLTKYNNAASDGVVDNISTLAHYDDAARVNWGGKWRMPSSYEIDELIKNCTWTVFEKNGINGYKATSKINGNSIFFPTAGVFSELDVYNAGSIGYYWSRSLASNYQYMALYLSMRLNGNVERTPDVRYRGRSVRAVFSDNDKPSTFVTLTFNANAGTGDLAVQTFEAGVSQALAANAFIRSGYAFVGWNTASGGSGTNYTDKQSITISQDITLYAQWEKGKVVSGTENGHDYVDLGLSVKWATCNVGATTPDGYGDYFAWGETSPKDNYQWSTYKYCNGSETSLTKYNTSSDYGTVDNKTTLELSDDAARANWGGKWRMSTQAEQDELRNNCTWTWTTQSGVNGYKVTSNTNGNSIFLPAAGFRSGTSVTYVGSRGFYLSSSLDESHPSYAYYSFFYSGSMDLSYSHRRYYGRTVRAVCP